MSWLFSQALVEEYSVGTSLAGAPSSQLNVTPTQHKFWRNDKTIDASDHSRFGLTSQLLTVAHGAELLMSYLAAFPAKTSAQLEAAPESMVRAADSGPIWRGSFARYDRDSSMWKTAQSSLLGGSDEFSETWPRWGSMRSGVSFLRPIPALPICASASGLWQTPVADDAVNRASGKWNSRGEPKLSAEVKLWTTPSASDARRGGTITPAMTGTSLAQQVNTPLRWPTPKASIRGDCPSERRRRSPDLAAVVNMWPTPNASDASKWSNQSLAERKAKGQQVRLNTAVAPEGGMGGQLNPAWVEWLMGWPIGWTELKPLEMARFREWQQQHGSF